jgi:[ribosomal protein S18]-alanine N-acetyltransferase
MTSPHPHKIVNLRPALECDLPDILQIERLSFIHASERFSARKIRYLMRSPRIISSVAECDGIVMGWAAGHLWKSSLPTWGRVYALAVHPDSRGMKLGSRLLLHLIQTLRQRGALDLFLEVRSDNHDAIKLYKKVGFVPCDTLEHYYAHGLTAIRMRLNPPPDLEPPPINNLP